MSSTTATFTIEDTTDPSIDTEASNETAEELRRQHGSPQHVAGQQWRSDSQRRVQRRNLGNNYTSLSDDCGETG